MSEVNQAALDFLLTRRSRPAKTLSPVAPSTDELNLLLTAAARTPDHGKLEPFRFIVIRGEARSRFSDALAAHMSAAGEDPANTEKHAGRFLHGGVIVVVVFSPKPSKKIPEWEQHLSAGGACLSLLNAALAMGWGANWLTGEAAERRAFLEADLGLAPHESAAGFIHIGREMITPHDRPRPDIGAITSWIEA